MTPRRIREITIDELSARISKDGDAYFDKQMGWLFGRDGVKPWRLNQPLEVYALEYGYITPWERLRKADRSDVRAFVDLSMTDDQYDQLLDLALYWWWDRNAKKIADAAINPRPVYKRWMLRNKLQYANRKDTNRRVVTNGTPT